MQQSSNAAVMLHVRRVQHPRSLSSDWSCGLHSISVVLIVPTVLIQWRRVSIDVHHVLCRHMQLYDQQRWFCWISRDGSFMIRAFPSGIITGIINWCHSEHGQLWTRSLTTNQSSLQMCFSNASRIAGANGRMKFKDSERGRRERRKS